MVVLGGGAQALQSGLTVVRLRGSLLFSLRTAATVADGYSGAFGIGVVKAAAFAIGVTAILTPITESESDWLYWMPIQLTATATAPTWAGSGPATARMEVDTRAMRKLELGDTIYAAAEVTEVGAANLDIMFDSRILLKLP